MQQQHKAKLESGDGRPSQVVRPQAASIDVQGCSEGRSSGSRLLCSLFSPIKNNLASLLGPLEFSIFAAIAGLVTYHSYRWLSQYYKDIETRDLIFILLLPFISEVSFLLAKSIRYVTVSSKEPSREVSLAVACITFPLLLLPCAAGCYAFLSVKPVSISALLVGSVLFIHQVFRRRFDLLKYLEIVEIPLAVLVIAAGLKAMVLNALKDTHHWGYYLGPVHSVMEGGQLLWDTPSQYGFLSILTIVATAKAFSIQAMDSMCLVVAAFELAAIIVTFCLFRFRLRLGTLFSAAAAALVHLCFPGWILSLAGPIAYPSTSALRFLPSFISLLAFEYAVRTRRPLYVWSSGLLLSIACLWSPESCLYTVGPVSLFVAFSFLISPSISFFASTPIRICMLAVGMMGFFLGAYTLAYSNVIDIEGFYEYARSYTNDFGLLPVTLDAWTGFLVTLLAIFYFCAREQFSRGLEGATQGVIFFAYAMTLSSYFVARSHYQNILNITPWLLSALAAMRLHPREASWRIQRVIIFIVFASGVSVLVSVYPEKSTIIAKQLADDRLYSKPDFAPVYNEVIRAALSTVDSDRFTILHDDSLYLYYNDVKIKQYTFPFSPRKHYFLLPESRVRTYLIRNLTKTPLSYILCPGTECAKVPTQFAHLSDLVEIKEIPLENPYGWRLLELKRKAPEPSGISSGS